MSMKKTWLLGLASLSLTLCGSFLSAAEDQPKKPAPAAKKDTTKKSDPKSDDKSAKESAESGDDEEKPKKDPFAVPADAKPDELVEFTRKLVERPARFKSVKERDAYVKKLVPSMIEATDKVLAAGDVEEDIAGEALELRFLAINLSSIIGDADAPKHETELAKKFAADPRAKLARMAKAKLLTADLKRFTELKSDEQEKLLEDAVALVKGDGKLNQKSQQMAMTFGRTLEGGGHDAAAAKLFNLLGEVFAASDDEDLADFGKKLGLMAKEKALFAKLKNIKDLKTDEQEQLLEEVTSMVKRKGKLTQDSQQAALELGQAVESTGNIEVAAKVYDRLGDLFGHSGDEELETFGKKLHGMAVRVQLVGHPIEIEGDLVTGKPVDWDSYKGKVVLVDFWATWCGPCIQELPNVKRNYMGYHSKGFDVVGISLDNSKAKLERFIAKNHLPWANLFSSDESATGWEHPLAAKYGVMGIPFTVLVGKDGNVIKMNVRGDALGEALKELLGDPDEEAIKAAIAAEEKLHEEEEQAEEEAARKKAAAKKEKDAKDEDKDDEKEPEEKE